MDVVQQTSRPGSPEHSLVVPLRDLDAGALSLAGGKAANLGELIRAGLPVPDGFCVTTDAYRDVTIAADLSEIVEELAGIAGDAPERAAAIAGRARDRILSTAMPAHVAAAVTSAYRALGEPAVAVRSSATAEDLPFASFAGQQDTFLGITGADAVLDAVHRCWASLWTDRAVVVPRPQWDRPCRDSAGRRGAADGGRRGGRRDVHRQPGDGTARGDRHRRQPRPGGGSGQRVGQPGPLRPRQQDRRHARTAPGGQAPRRPLAPRRRHGSGRSAGIGHRMRVRRPIARAGRTRFPGPGALRPPAGHRVGHRPGRCPVAHAGPAGHNPVPTPGRRFDLRTSSASTSASAWRRG